MKTAPLFFALAATLFASACVTDLAGSGVPKDATIDVAPFHRVYVENAIPVEVEVGPAGPVEIHGDDNIVPLIRVAVVGDELRVDVPYDRTVAPTEPLRIVVRAPVVDAITASGASTVHATGLAGQGVSLTASGASTLVASGAIANANESASGGSTIDATALAADAVHLDLSGASKGHVRATSSADGLVSGGSSAEVYGAPSTRKVETSGGSRVDYR